ncbi:MAG TPA: hypothetical protein VK756_07795 [Solirubrobacteraceae bacterium]|jgi:hypothetical protein|nr:hypothetical protein [Solirubrobacteraceae bacterium]
MALKSAFRAVLAVANSAGVFEEWPPATGGMWDAFAGGKLTMKETKYTPWSGEQRVYAGIKETENYTLEQDYMIDLHGPLVKQWEVEGDLRGRRCLVTIIERDTEGQWQYNREAKEGQVLEITLPDGDSNDASAIDKIGLIVSIGKPAGEGE